VPGFSLTFGRAKPSVLLRNRSSLQLNLTNVLTEKVKMDDNFGAMRLRFTVETALQLCCERIAKHINILLYTRPILSPDRESTSRVRRNRQLILVRVNGVGKTNHSRPGYF